MLFRDEDKEVKEEAFGLGRLTVSLRRPRWRRGGQRL
jgi:hypothetical protein